MSAKDYLKEYRIYEDEVIYNTVGESAGTLSQLMDEYSDHVNQENASLKAQRDELLEVLKGSLEMMKQFSSYRKTQGLTAGNVFLDSTIEQAEKAIQHCR